MSTTRLAKGIIKTLLKIPAMDLETQPTEKIPSMIGKTAAKKIKLESGVLSDKVIFDLLDEVEIILIGEENVLQVKPPCVVVGDIHGQFSDLLDLFGRTGLLSALNTSEELKEQFLFLGDYVDRGPRSLETICFLFALKLLYPDSMMLLRGNHECWYVNKTYGFYDEVRLRYSQKLWRRFTNVFQYLPIAAIIDERIFCCHGGISPSLVETRGGLKAIERIPRPIEIPSKGLLCDLLWSDPDANVDEFGPNSRGTSYVFGKKALNSFLDRYDFDLICRGHQVIQDGYEFFHDKKLVTVFSAPNYCNFGNTAAYMTVDENLVCAFNLLKKRKNENEFI
eukprot:GAHX01001784.1.p1 GENE.GAHX01001784.1~~GAHX01001784.1.p1  ORF type:complete len:337 (-),score=56.52 GAHX01001784.1:172-1182(-)